MASQRFEDLIVWQKAHTFVLQTYDLTSRFPREEMFGLTSQLRRAAVSVPANIAEGFKRAGKGDKLRFFNISQGSIEECQYYLILARDLGYADTDQLRTVLDEVAKILESYMARIRSDRSRGMRALFWLLAPLLAVRPLSFLTSNF